MDATIIFIFIVAILLVGYLVVYAYQAEEKRKKKTETLFNDDLFPLLDTAFTRKEINEALQKIVLSCLKVETMQEYTRENAPFRYEIHESYIPEYLRLKERLIGRRDQIMNDEINEVNNDTGEKETT